MRRTPHIATRPRVAVPLASLALLLGLSWSSPPAQAIVNGTDAPATPPARSTVSVGACTGTLVRSDLVLTASHCVDRPETPPAGVTPFRSHRDWEYPDRFYPLRWPVTVSVGTRVASPVFETRTRSYASPGMADIILLRLDSHVPASAAPPVPITTHIPDWSADPRAWLAGRTFQIAGFGDDDDTDGEVRLSTHLNQGLVNNAVFPCPRGSDGWEFGEAHKLCVDSADGSGTRPGDSGGPLYWVDGTSTRRLAAVFQGLERRNGGRYTALFYRGGGTYDGRSLSNLGGWVEQHVRGSSGATAFLRTSADAVDEVVDPAYAASPAGLAARVRRISIGVYEAEFPGLLQTELREPRVALVTALGTDANYCKLRSASAADRVLVACYTTAGAPADARFSLVTDISDTDLLVRVPLGATSARSGRGSVTVSRAAPGLYDVAGPALAGAGWKNVLTSADGESDARCHATYSGAASARVRCLTAAGAAVDSGFTLAATSADGSGYALGNRPTTASYVARDAFANVPGTSSSPTITRSGAGRYEVSFAGSPANLGGNVQATAFGNTRNHCKVAGWSADAAEVVCLSPAGAAEDTQFAVRFIDPLDAGRLVYVGVRELRGASADPCATMNMSGTLSFTSGASRSAAIPLATGAVRVFSPPIAVSATSRPGQRYVEFQLAIRDQDPDPICGTDDTLDLAPRSSVEVLRGRIDLQAHTVEMVDSNPGVLGGLGTWWSDGRTGDEIGKALFDVEIMSPFGLT